LASGVTQVRLYYYDGYAYTVALKSDGTIYSCGYNGHGELGNGNTVNQNTFVQSRLKDLNNNFLNLKVTRLVNTNSWCVFSNMVLAEDGKLYVSGYNAPVYHGTSTTWGSEDTYLKPVANLTNVIDCVSGGSWTKNCFMALSLDGTVRTWGNNDGGQLGLGDSTDRYTPTLVPVIRAKKLAEVNSWNPNTSFVLIGTDGYVYVAGNRVPNQRGAWTENTKSFNRVPIPNIVEVAVSTHSGTFNGVILLDNLNRVFVSTSYDGHYFGGPQNSVVRNVAEFTNYLV
jgi:alpha-tubulin suppressor-like RCC1 family protein